MKGKTFHVTECFQGRLDCRHIFNPGILMGGLFGMDIFLIPTVKRWTPPERYKSLLLPFIQATSPRNIL